MTGKSRLVLTVGVGGCKRDEKSFPSLLTQFGSTRVAKRNQPSRKLEWIWDGGKRKEALEGAVDSS